MTDSLLEVRAVLAAELNGELAGAALVNRCTDVARRLHSNDVPHEVWHYLSDADIRVRDREYAKAQLEHIKGVLYEVLP